MQKYSGPTWEVEEPGTGHYYTFTSEEFALWFRSRRTVHRMLKGSQPTDDGNFFLTPAERTEVILREPELARFIRRVYGSKEFIQNIERYCFWLVDAEPSDIKHSKILYERVRKVKEFRLASQSAQTRKDADIPYLFQQIRQPTTPYLLIPSVSSERRQYIPIGYVPPEVIVTNLAFSLEYATPYHLAVLTSKPHMAWMRVVAGRLRNDYRYSNTVVYNNFVWPPSNPHQAMRIERAGIKILKARENHPRSSYADLYDEISMPKDLREAHRENDAAVLEAYGLKPDTSEYDIVNHLFRLNYKFTGREFPES